MPDVVSSLGKPNVTCYRSVACAVEQAERDRVRQSFRLTDDGGPLRPLKQAPQVFQDRFSNDKHEKAGHATWKSAPSLVGHATWKSSSSVASRAKKVDIPLFARTDGFRMTAAKKPAFTMSPDAQHVHFSQLTNRWVPQKRSTLASLSSPLKKPMKDSIPGLRSLTVSKESTELREPSREAVVSDDTDNLPDSSSLIEMQIASRRITDDLNHMLHRLYNGLDEEETAELQKQRLASRNSLGENVARRRISSGSSSEPFWQEKSQCFSTRDVAKGVHARRKAVRGALRDALINATGSSWEAYRFLDANNNNSLSLTEFYDGLDRLGIDWAAVTSVTRKMELFKLLDANGSGFLDMQELFPIDSLFMDQLRRTSTPDFWKNWCRRNTTSEIGAPSWKPERGRQIQYLLSSNDHLDKIDVRRKWIKQTTQRLKRLGRSDGCVRNVVCSHLPRGTGSTDRDRVPAFGAEDLLGCKKVYSEEVRKPVMKIQKFFHDFGDMRRQLRYSRLCLKGVLEKMSVKKEEEEEERRKAAKDIEEARIALEKTKKKSVKVGATSKISEDQLRFLRAGFDSINTDGSGR
eukprot:GEMP01008491.1.p1 GENE.GEMP01008491.1~~GEMP01008491.1.p1  ORF type:complete len:576 (+),score=109.58 GEMP01008491.1:95-1822(+)